MRLIYGPQHILGIISNSVFNDIILHHINTSQTKINNYKKY